MSNSEEYIIYEWDPKSRKPIAALDEVKDLWIAREKTMTLCGEGKKAFYMRKSEFLEKYPYIHEDYLEHKAKTKVEDEEDEN